MKKVLTAALAACCCTLSPARAETWPNDVIFSCDSAFTTASDRQMLGLPSELLGPCSEPDSSGVDEEKAYWTALVAVASEWFAMHAVPPPRLGQSNDVLTIYDMGATGGRWRQTPLAHHFVALDRFLARVTDGGPGDPTDPANLSQVGHALYSGAAAGYAAGPDQAGSCALWLQEGLAGAAGGLLALNYRGRPAVPGRDFDVPWHIPEDREAGGGLSGTEIDTSCEPRENPSGSERGDRGRSNAILFTRLAEALARGGTGGNPHFRPTSRAMVTLDLLYTSITAPAANERGKVAAALDQALRVHHPRGLNHFYPEIMRTIVTEGARMDRLFREARTAKGRVGAMIGFPDRRVHPLATHGWTIDVPQHARPVRVTLTARPNVEEKMPDLHLIVDGDLHRTVKGMLQASLIFFPSDTDRTFNAGVALAPRPQAELASALYELEVDVREVGLCDAETMEALSNPQMYKMLGAFAAGVGAGDDLPDELRELLGGILGGGSPAIEPTIGALELRLGGIRAGGLACADPLAAMGPGGAGGDLVISLFTPAPVTVMGGGFDGMSVAHDGWEGWPANAKAQVHVQLIGVSEDDLEEGRSYPARLTGLQGADFAPIFSRYEGTFYDYIPYQEAFTGQSQMVMPEAVAGTVTIERMSGGTVEGRLRLAGTALRFDIEHTMREGGGSTPTFEWEGAETRVPLSISGRFVIAATDSGTVLMRDAGTLRTIAID
ncbi:hypothetical protein [Loktanella sp. SALINAS62]|uniref:hypothetical protein n=1 Tax=Loktanella sp. SALINAS62 TaxID=2706124 RepID=UPI001B8AC4E7|nr:hypothetical protein [Loktanella sp. SALINAS62]MBS1303395.1 hypothetical protein [Loktanella sp. SALINAS62]